MLEGKIKIGIVDDNPSLSEGLQLFLEENDVQVLFAVNSKTPFFEALENHDVDLVLVDVIMPDVVGLELFEKLNEKHSRLPVIVYSNIRNIQLINDLFRLENTFALVSKSEPLTLLLETIHSIFTDKKRRFPDEYLNLNHKDISLKLTEREIQVLKRMAEGLSSKAIGDQLSISENTVLFHKKKLFTVFNTSNIYHLIVEAKECGFLN